MTNTERYFVAVLAGATPATARTVLCSEDSGILEGLRGILSRRMLDGCLRPLGTPEAPLDQVGEQGIVARVAATPRGSRVQGSSSIPGSAVTNALQLLTEEAAAAALDVSPRTLSGWRSRGGGPRFLKLGSAGKTSPVRYSRAALEKYQSERERLSTSDMGTAGRKGTAK